VSNLEFEKKITIFAATIIFYIIFCIWLHFWQKGRAISETSGKSAEEIFNAEVEKQLLALEEASQFFGASLKTADMFRLAASRVREIVPHSASALFLIDEIETNLKIIGANGENSREILEIGQISRKGLAGICLNSRKIKRDEKLRLEKNVFPHSALKYLESAIAVPLFENSEKVFGVLVLYARNGESFDDLAETILEAIGERLAPLILSSLAFERSLFNALTDALTNLPNERAFYLILENQIAESQRTPEERPLTILSIDIQNFNELNQKFGHATGDKILAFTAEIIKKQLRKMDFLARASQDEFLAVLPTAGDSTALEIIERIEKVFQTAPFRIAPGENQFLKMNIGAATVFKHGETAGELLKIARLKKATAKAGSDAKIIWFPKEFVN
jgi:diguanylate cyclase (GGDEF)-like protein